MLFTRTPWLLGHFKDVFWLDIVSVSYILNVFPCINNVLVINQILVRRTVEGVLLFFFRLINHNVIMSSLYCLSLGFTAAYLNVIEFVMILSKSWLLVTIIRL